MLERLLYLWPELLTTLTAAVSLLAAGHAVLNKRDTRATIGWVGIIWLVPLLGALLYFVFGINRIHRRARSLWAVPQQQQPPLSDVSSSAPTIAQQLGADYAYFGALVQLVRRVTQRPLLPGNRLEPLVDGDAAYPAMLEALGAARKTVTLSTYIFDNDRAGRMFLEALSDCVARGVEVRVLIDDVGSRYTWPSIVRPLRQAQIPVAKFLPTFVPWRFRYSNLRNHRKILVVDGQIGFTGGINIRDGSLLKLSPRHPIHDLHFRVQGPVVSHLQEAFAYDWEFATGELLHGESWFPSLDPAGQAPARGVSDGPDDDFDKLRMVLLGAIAGARSSIEIISPYFLPDEAIATALNVAAMRGVAVRILLPQKNNLILVHWAMLGTLWQVLEGGCRVWLSPPPFDHSKVLIVDRVWSLIGSANWDPRSLRLNFEFNVECYDFELADQLHRLVESKRQRGSELTLAQLQQRSLLLRLRDGLARLASPYL